MAFLKKVDIIEPKNNDEKYAQFIYESLHQLKAVMKIDYVEVAVIVIQIHNIFSLNTLIINE